MITPKSNQRCTNDRGALLAAIRRHGHGLPGGSVVAPALIGALSSVVGLRVALGSIALAALLLAFLAGRMNRPAHPSL